jgi:hypothetical protein
MTLPADAGILTVSRHAQRHDIPNCAQTSMLLCTASTYSSRAAVSAGVMVGSTAAMRMVDQESRDLPASAHRPGGPMAAD